MMILISTGPVTGLLSIHWAVPELAANNIHIKWSITLSTSTVVIASTSCLDIMVPVEVSAVWTCLVSGSVLRVLTAEGVQGEVDLSHCPAVTGALIISRQPVKEESLHMHGVWSVILSCVGGRFFELQLRISESSCTAISMRERYFHVPSEQASVAGSVRRSYVMLPCCTALARVRVNALQGEAHNAGAQQQCEPLVLVGYHSHFGLQLIVEGKSS
jgi:hypothetical protein